MKSGLIISILCVLLTVGCHTEKPPPPELKRMAEPVKPLEIDELTPNEDDYFTARKSEREKMVRTQMSGLGRPAVDDKATLNSLLRVPRHLFVPDPMKLSAYQDRPLPIGEGQTISQPYIVGLMTQLLELEPGEKVLEIGTGSGYQAAVLAEITDEVFTIEIIEKLAERAKHNLEILGYDSVRVKTADGYFGWEEEALFDGIIVTCASGHIPPPLTAQLKPGGVMVIPIGSPYQVQRLVLVSKEPDGKLTTEDIIPVGFVPMTGRAGEGE